jgi:uncharacterized damage-inducible protein DinB
MVRDEIPASLAHFAAAHLWEQPGGAASVGYHLLHLAGSTDRLLTYARGEALSEAQREELRLERDPASSGRTLQQLQDGVRNAIDHVFEVLRATRREALDSPRTVGRLALPTNVRGLLFHIAEHAQRHNGQIATTVRIVGQA